MAVDGAGSLEGLWETEFPACYDQGKVSETRCIAMNEKWTKNFLFLLSGVGARKAIHFAQPAFFFLTSPAHIGTSLECYSSIFRSFRSMSSLQLVGPRISFFLRLLGSVATFFPLISTSNFSLLETRGVALYISSSIPRLLGRTLWLKR